ncbi:SusC/RagA family TonB-linked outer membrane protein [Maribacter sp. 2-571]|uniref:SusC/RagA family TonB-linked outer membrane protein n=1 Tax=Maribacter sp. 2-571 TaxID=3417569 RepID=UPI003D3314A8
MTNKLLTASLAQSIGRHNRSYRTFLVALGMAVLLCMPISVAARTVTAPTSALFQDTRVSGTIVDQDGVPLPGASVVEMGTTNGTQTDFDGNYSLEVGSDAVLLISYIGYESQEIAVNGQTTINATLQPGTSQLDEVVVVAYGVQSRRKVTTAVANLGGEEIAELPVVRAEQALQGRVSGVNVVQSGVPGANPTVRIRGLGSVLNSDPLFVIDGIPVGQGGLNDVAPDAIEDITVLKDAASTAIYGSRGANGVVLVTTKKGKRGPGKLTFKSYYGIQKVPERRRYDLLNTDQYINFTLNDFIVEPARFDDYDFDEMDFRVGSPSEEFRGVETDWQDAVMPLGGIQEYQLGFSGGTDNVTYNLGGGYFEQDGVIVNSYFKRINFNANIQANLGKFKMGSSIILSRNSLNEPEGDGISIRRSLQMMPYIPVRDASRPGGFRGTDNADGADPFQPVLRESLIDDEQTSTKVLVTAFGQYEVANGLFAKLAVAGESAFIQSQFFLPTYNAGEIGFNQNPVATYQRTKTTFVSPILTATLNYNKDFGDHNLDLLGGYEIQTFRNERVRAEATALPNENIRNPALSPGEDQRAEVVLEETGIISYFGRLNYDYKGKYLLGASIRRDQSSRFAPDDNVGIFPSASAGWTISEEGFFEGLRETVTNLKLRGSWGINGNTATGAYTWDPTVVANLDYDLGDGSVVTGLTQNALFNTRLQWEEVEKINVGLDAEFFGGKFYFSGEYFKNTANDLIISVPIPNSTGVDNRPLANVGSVENSGWDFSAGYTNQDNELKWSVSAVASLVDNEVTSLGGDESASIFGENFQNTGAPQTRAVVGEPIGHYFGLRTDGIYQTQAEIDADNARAAQLTGDSNATRQGADVGPGDIRYQDINGDGVVTGEDRVNIGHYLPDFTIGLNTNMSYKNFDLAMNWQGSFGFEVLHSNRYYTEGMTRLFNMGTEVLNAWTPENTNTDIPRTFGINQETGAREARQANAVLSDRWVENGDFVRLQFVTLGYTFPELKNSPFSKLRLYAQAQNLLTFTGYSGYNPEVQGRVSNPNDALFSNGVDDSAIPVPSTFILGVEVAF